MYVPYATLQELMFGWRDLSEQEKQTAEAGLYDASVTLAALLRAKDLDPSMVDPDVMNLVVRNMVKRAMPANQPLPSGVQSQQFGVDIFQRTLTFASPTGEVYLTKIEKTMLGLSAQVATTVPMSAPGAGAVVSGEGVAAAFSAVVPEPL